MFQKILKNNNFIAIIGPSGSGKTKALKELYKKFKDEAIYFDNDFNFDMIASKKLVFIDDGFWHMRNNEKKELFAEFITKKIKVVFTTTNVEEILFADYIYVLNNCKIEIEGQTNHVLKEEKTLKKLGLKNPFIIDLSIQLKHYNLVDKLYKNEQELVGDLWK